MGNLNWWTHFLTSLATLVTAVAALIQTIRITRKADRNYKATKKLGEQQQDRQQPAPSTMIQGTGKKS